MIVNITLTDFTQSRPRNYEWNYLEDITNDIIILHNEGCNTHASRYEVLNKSVRKVYFDIEKIPTDQPELIYQILSELNKFFKSKAPEQVEDDMEFVVTHNKASATHEGLSYHAICWNYSMDYKNLKGLVLEFINTVGSKYNEYIDSAVYSSIRLFKLPYYIGLQKQNGLDTNPDNYHYMLNTPEELDEEYVSKYLIQYTKNTKELTIDFEDKPSYHANNISFRRGTPGLKGVTNKLVQIEQILQNRTSGYTYKNVMSICDRLYDKLDCERLGEVSKRKINEIHDELKSGIMLANEKIQRYGALLNTIAVKYNI